ncbi:hypothetical protein ANCCAN_01235 [Ancylostoma caninum]|uniref:Uncharacterized protein n=1 Tax=Ancylostoma caninum TaxID=29170 RepID=A0A368HB34_ANCCA|nr:hypothetical protein ANCCAN_01235 [Ancylostoma caninum]
MPAPENTLDTAVSYFLTFPIVIALYRLFLVPYSHGLPTAVAFQDRERQKPLHDVGLDGIRGHALSERGFSLHMLRNCWKHKKNLDTIMS